ncbi:hypothetical protein UFOVP215_12 [uncultured Caudovirales phage]|uniref:Uncharacterized protein n=1 Tax=uncultured Caudovirales phage TaxID=2100421 RepID=A0A6J7WQ09_9CAUD|nr:hypothetical protein UFOVP215_12 [uncultured Caudovirales phage]
MIGIIIFCSAIITTLIVLNSILNAKIRKEYEEEEIQRTDSSASKRIKEKYKL